MCKKFLCMILSMLAALTIACSAYAASPFPVIIEDDFEDSSNWILSPATDGCVTVSDGMLRIKALYAANTHKAEANGWTINGDYIAEVSGVEVDFGTSSNKLPSNLGFLLYKDAKGNGYYFSGMRFPQDEDPDGNFGICIGQGTKEQKADLEKSASKIDIANLEGFKFIVAGGTIEVQVRYKDSSEYVSVITYQNEALKNGTPVFSPSVREHYPHNAGIMIDKVLIYNTDCLIDKVEQKTENGTADLKEASVNADVFMESLKTEFLVDMKTENYANITLYEKENPESTAALSITESDSRSVSLAPQARLKSGTEYVLDYGTQVTGDGYVFDKMAVSFKTKNDPAEITASAENGQLSGSVVFNGGETSVTVIPAVYQNGMMIKVLTPIELTAEKRSFSNISLGEISGSYTVRLFGWDDKDGSKMFCKPLTIEVKG